MGCDKLENITLGTGITAIGQQVFYQCSLLTEIVIPENVTSIGSNAFSGCRNLKTITIYDGLTSIGSSAFSDCRALETVNFTVTEDAWNSISISYGNDNLKNASFNFNYNISTEPKEDVPVSPYLSFALNEDGQSYYVSDCDTSATGEIVIPGDLQGSVCDRYW